MVKMQLLIKNFIYTFNFRLFYKHRINLEEKGEESIGHLVSYIFEERAGAEVNKIEYYMWFWMRHNPSYLITCQKKKKKNPAFWKTKLPNIYFHFFSNHHFLLLSVSPCQDSRVSLIFVIGSLLFESVHFIVELLQF